LKQETGISYEGMLFFDDSVWSDHCRMVETNCEGVVTQKTPHGMTTTDWYNRLKKYAAKNAAMR
jgi:hypothetical protein